ncbi:SigE family RNA polymerase sigma factor [Amycolatopsis sp. cg5]|uniref:SigE family RNA polymerase sigma factor n=1 Tax=Amycolatopsis sp. cg5 TaxID=3238802 RepID=UPI0035254980
MTFEEFVAARLDPLLRYAARLCCDPHLAQDVVQEALLRAQQHWSRIAAMESPEAYVKRMVTNEYLSWRRRRSTKDVTVSLSQLDVLTPPAADASAQYDERDAMLAKIAGLPRKQRAAVVLRYYSGCDDAEIASVLGCREVTVRGYISRAIAKLRAAESASASVLPLPLPLTSEMS